MNAHLDFSTHQVIAVLIGVIAVLYAVVFAGRWLVQRASLHRLAGIHGSARTSSLVTGRTKYANVEVMQYRPLGLLMGIITALVLTTALMNWTVINQDKDYQQTVAYTEMEIEVTPPQTAEPPLPPPPPPPPTIIEVPDNLIDDTDESIEFLDQSIEAETQLDIPAPPVEETKEFVAPPPPPPIKEDVEEIFKVVEEMPRFPGCEDIAGTADEKKVCAEKALFAFINSNLNYPSSARENNIQGNVVVQFVVNKDGTVQDIAVLRDIGAGCGEEVVRVVRLMNERNLHWNPGKQRGKPVRVMFVLPVKFSLLAN